MKRRPNYQDISWFLDLVRNGQLDLDPPYQRKSVWSPKDRRFFLDTIFRDYPSPGIFLHKETGDDGRAVYHVVDGKQRLETILLFVNNKLRISKDYGDVTLAGKRWEDLDPEPTLKKAFWDYVLPVEFIDVIDGTLVEEVFDRLNRNSRKLERQELRHAKYDGWLITQAEDEAKKSEWAAWKVTTTARARRMKDVQFISELLAVVLVDQQLGFDQDDLDALYAEYDTPEEEDGVAFNEEEYLEKLNAIKSFVADIEQENSCVSMHAKTFNSFYSLWSLIALNLGDLPEAGVFAQKFKNFMMKVEELAGAVDADAFVTEKGEPYKIAAVYYNNSRGASTDLTQRAARLEALREAVVVS